MMRSIKARLLLGTIGAMALLLVVFALVVYEVMQRSLVAGFDELLTSIALTTSGFVEQDEAGIICDPDEREVPGFFRAVRPDYFELWDERGVTLARSPSLKQADLERFESNLGSMVYRRTQ